ncbi:MAG: hypothetical protein MUC36_10700 [Planctomycetes bacterium]|jgi:hypothetical protein|nr:hypothetical protein [Planctomycetota bacterium]
MKTRFFLACALAVTNLPAQDPSEWLRDMRTRLDVDLRGLQPDRIYAMTEEPNWASVGGERSPAQKTELFFGGSDQWRLYHTVSERARIDYARTGASAWDLAGGVLVTFHERHGRLPGGQDLNQPIRSRLASFGYCLTGGLHLLTIMGLGETQLERPSEHTWRMHAAGNGSRLTFEGSWEAAYSGWRVDRITVVESPMPARIGDRWQFGDWRLCPETGWTVAGSALGFDASGRQTSMRKLEPIVPLQPAVLATVTDRPKPDTEVPLVGRAAIEEWRNCEFGQEQSNAWLRGRWVPVVTGEGEGRAAFLIRLSGWILGLIVIGHGIAMRRMARKAVAGTA